MPCQEEQMSDSLQKVELLVSKMEMLYNSAKERQENWEKIMSNGMEYQKERLDVIDKRWAFLMRIVVSVFVLVLGTAVTGGFVIDKRTTEDDVKYMIKEFAREDDVGRAFGTVTEDAYDVYKEKGLMSPEEARDGEADLKGKINEDFGDSYRTAKEIKNGN